MTNPTLENNRVILTPLGLDNYLELAAVAKEKNLIQYSPSTIETEAELKNYVLKALEQNNNSQAIPFLVYDKQSQAYAGCTRYMNIDWINKNLEIGSTWIGKNFQGTGLNGKMKRLMIDYAFQNMGFERITFKVDERNVRSRKAVEKLNAVLEGILRQDVYLSKEYKRNTCVYSILKNEWAGK